jgi:hypothetical protein
MSCRFKPAWARTGKAAETMKEGGMLRMAMAGMAMLCVGAAAPEPEPLLPGWMAGCWIQEKGDRWTEECWTAPRAGTMMGSSRMGRGETLGAWETLRIVRNHKSGDGPAIPMAYIASPGGGPATVFTWTPNGTQDAIFVNAAHDYPQRIRYWREGELLMAEISLADGSKPMRWTYKRLG